jgi:hypothetical protein
MLHRKQETAEKRIAEELGVETNEEAADYGWLAEELTEELRLDNQETQTANRHNMLKEERRYRTPIDLTLIKSEEELDEWYGKFYDDVDLNVFFAAYHQGYQLFQPEGEYNMPRNYRKSLWMSTNQPKTQTNTPKQFSSQIKLDNTTPYKIPKNKKTHQKETNYPNSLRK